MKKFYLSYMLSILLFIISCFFKQNIKIVFEVFSLFFLLEEKIEYLFHNTWVFKRTRTLFIDIFVAICFFLLKEERLFLIYKILEQGVHLLFINQFGSEKGIDLGIKALVVTSNGEEFDNPKVLSKYEKRIKRLQRKLSRCEKGSKNREKVKFRIGIDHYVLREKIPEHSRRGIPVFHPGLYLC